MAPPQTVKQSRVVAPAVRLCLPCLVWVWGALLYSSHALLCFSCSVLIGRIAFCFVSDLFFSPCDFDFFSPYRGHAAFYVYVFQASTPSSLLSGAGPSSAPSVDPVRLSIEGWFRSPRSNNVCDISNYHWITFRVFWSVSPFLRVRDDHLMFTFRLSCSLSRSFPVLARTKRPKWTSWYECLAIQFTFTKK